MRGGEKQHVVQRFDVLSGGGASEKMMYRQKAEDFSAQDRLSSERRRGTSILVKGFSSSIAHLCVCDRVTGLHLGGVTFLGSANGL